MCYGECKYENYFTGECRFTNKFPADAACMQNYEEMFEDDNDPLDGLLAEEDETGLE
jgi:hypothetical protein